VAKRRDSLYRPGEHGWIKVKNRGYWRFGEEREHIGRRRTEAAWLPPLLGMRA
jgi:ATP-dependent DNA ligase